MADFFYYAFGESYEPDLEGASALIRIELSEEEELYQGLDRRNVKAPQFLESNFLFTRYFIGDDAPGTFKITVEQAKSLLKRWGIDTALEEIPTVVIDYESVMGGAEEE